MKQTQDNYAALIDKLNNPIPLFFKDDPVPAVWACGNCERIAGTEKQARHCYPCAPKACDRCGDRVEPRGYCRPCSEIRSYEKEQAAFEKAKKIEEKHYNGPVVYNNKFYHDVDDICYDLEDDEEFPKWAWACTSHHPSYDASDMLQHVDENSMLEEGIDWDDTKGLFEFVDKWFEKQSAYWWEEDNSRAVLLVSRERED